MITILKNKITGLYFGHLDEYCSNSVDYSNINCAYKFDKFINLFEQEYDNIDYIKELRKIKLKKLS